MWRRHRAEIVICVVDKNVLLRFVAYDIVLSWSLYAGLKRLHLPEWIPLTASMLAPAIMRRLLHRGLYRTPRHRP